METLTLILTSGFVATIFLISIMFTFTWEGFQHGEMISTLASDVTRNKRQFFPRGLLLYAIIGMALSPIYYWVISLLNFESMVINLALGVFYGFSQGYVLTLIFVEGAILYHPIPVLNRFWIPIAGAHWAGHIAYGLALTAMYASYRIYGVERFLWTGALIMIASVVISYVVKRSTSRKVFGKPNNLKLSLPPNR